MSNTNIKVLQILHTVWYENNIYDIRNTVYSDINE